MGQFIGDYELRELLKRLEVKDDVPLMHQQLEECYKLHKLTGYTENDQAKYALLKAKIYFMQDPPSSDLANSFLASVKNICSTKVDPALLGLENLAKKVEKKHCLLATSPQVRGCGRG